MKRPIDDFSIRRRPGAYMEPTDPLLSFLADRFVLKCRFEDNRLPKEAGFQWDKTQKYWVTSEPAIANILARFADHHASAELLKQLGPKPQNPPDDDPPF